MNVSLKNEAREQADFEKEFESFLQAEKHLALMARKRAAKYGDRKVAARHRTTGAWESFTWGRLGTMIENAAAGLLAFGVKELEMVGIFAGNRAEWAVADFACFTVRACSVPVYATNSAKELEYIVNDAGIEVLFAGNREQYEKSLAVMKASKTLKKLVVFDRDIPLEKNDNVMHFDDFLAMGAAAGKKEEIEARVAKLQSDDLSTLIYTSGTTGEPKGVMLTHRNWLAMLFGAGYYMDIKESDVNLAFLPLSHVFERAWSYFILCNNAQVDYCHDTKAILDFLKESRPHYMCSVPRMWEKVHGMVNEQISQAPEKKRKIFNWALATGGEYQSRKRDGLSVGTGLALKHAVATALVLKKIRGIFGGRNKVYNVGGSAFSAEISEFFFRAGVLLLQGYGMTECFVISVANPEHNKFGTCGVVVPLMQVRISSEGEIQAKGPSMTKGYWKKDALTKELFTEDGWIRTGDVGTIDDEGFVTITDRIKDLMKTSGGKYISPQHIENLLKEDLYVEQAATIGDNRKYVSALVVPSFEPLESWARKQGIAFSSREELLATKAVQAFYRERIDRLTRDLGQVEKVKRFTLLPAEFTQENGEITPTMKLKRKVIAERYRTIIEDMYRE